MIPDKRSAFKVKAAIPSVAKAFNPDTHALLHRIVKFG
jgi:hypothetical protein